MFDWLDHDDENEETDVEEGDEEEADDDEDDNDRAAVEASFREQRAALRSSVHTSTPPRTDPGAPVRPDPPARG